MEKGQPGSLRSADVREDCVSSTLLDGGPTRGLLRGMVSGGKPEEVTRLPQVMVWWNGG